MELVAGGQPMSRAGRPAAGRCATLDIGCATGLGEGMNDPEVTMSNVLKNTNLVAHEKALEAAGAAITLAMRVPAPLKSIADQVIRSASSVPANLAEGHGRCGRDRLHFWRIAYASAKGGRQPLETPRSGWSRRQSQGRQGAWDLR